MIRNKHLKNEEGVVLLWAVLVTSLLALVVSFLTVIIIAEMRQSLQIDKSAQAYMAAEAGYERAINYAKNEQETNGAKSGCTDSEGDDTCDVKYEFQTVEASPSPGTDYDDSPMRQCISTSNVDYCFYTKGISGGSIRKLDGTVKIIPAEQSEAVDFGDSSITIKEDNPVGTIDILPQTLPANPNFFFYRGVVSGINTISDTEEYVFGLGFKESSPKKEGIGIKINKPGDKVLMTLVGVEVDTGIVTIDLSDDPIEIDTTASSNEIIITIEYRRGSTDPSKHTVSLQINEKKLDETKPCLGLITAVYNANILGGGIPSVPKAFFNYGGTGSLYTRAPEIDSASQQLKVYASKQQAPGNDDHILFKDPLLQIYE